MRTICQISVVTFSYHPQKISYYYYCQVYVCEECGHSTSDPEDHFRHLQQNHPFSPALARCHDKRQFKFHTDNCDKKDQTEADQSDTDVNSFVRNPVNTHDDTENNHSASVADINSRPVMESVRGRNDGAHNPSRHFVPDKTVVQENNDDNELSVAIQSVQSELNKMGAETTTQQTVKGAVTQPGRLRMNIHNSREIVMRERTSGYSPKKFPWKSPRNSPKKLTQSPLKSKVTKSPMKLGQWQPESFRIYEDVPQYDIENRRVQKLKQYGGDDYYKSKTTGLSESPVYRNNQSVENVRAKQFSSQGVRTLGQKQPLGNLTQNTQHLK